MCVLVSPRLQAAAVLRQASSAGMPFSSDSTLADTMTTSQLSSAARLRSACREADT
jgi:hypothetical protein